MDGAVAGGRDAVAAHGVGREGVNTIFTLRQINAELANKADAARKGGHGIKINRCAVGKAGDASV